MNEERQDEESWYKVAEVAELLKVEIQTVRRWIREKELPALALGQRAGYRIAAEDVEAFINKRMTGKAAA